MANLQETPEWEDGIYQFEETDVVQGGPQGIDNVPTGQLANRTAYLKKEQDALKKQFDSEETPDPLPQYALTNAFLRAHVFTPVHNTLAGYTPNPDYIAPSVGQKCYIAEYETVWELIQAGTNVIAEATKAASITNGSKTYAGYWGTGTDENGDFFTTPNVPEFMHYKAAGSYGVAGEFKEDHLQNITGSYSTRKIAGSDGGTAPNYFDVEGAISVSTITKQDTITVAITNNSEPLIDKVVFDASLTAKTHPDLTDTMGVFADPNIWLPKGAF